MDSEEDFSFGDVFAGSSGTDGYASWDEGSLQETEEEEEFNITLTSQNLKIVSPKATKPSISTSASSSDTDGYDNTDEDNSWNEGPIKLTSADNATKPLVFRITFKDAKKPKPLGRSPQIRDSLLKLK